MVMNHFLHGPQRKIIPYQDYFAPAILLLLAMTRNYKIPSLQGGYLAKGCTSPIKVWVSEKCSKKYSKKHSKNFYLLKKGLKKVNTLKKVLKKVLKKLTKKNSVKKVLKKVAQNKKGLKKVF